MVSKLYKLLGGQALTESDNQQNPWQKKISLFLDLKNL